jgi:hypothetical protein
MIQRDGSKARASAICIPGEHLVWTFEILPEKIATVLISAAAPLPEGFTIMQVKEKS